MPKGPQSLIAGCAVLALSGLWPLASAAQDTAPQTFSLPQGCTAYLTVQMKNCTVSHHFTCQGDPEGHQKRVDLDESGMTYLGTIDAETQWIESFHPMGGYSEMLAPNPGDPASFAALTQTGVDSYDFRTDSPEVGQTHFIGQDRLTGNSVVIDGVTLEETEFSIRALDSNGTEMWRSAGHEFINRDWRMFLSGKASVTTPTESWESDDTPVEFLFPGDPGFLSANPKHGCGAAISQLSTLEETNHDHL